MVPGGVNKLSRHCKWTQLNLWMAISIIDGVLHLQTFNRQSMWRVSLVNCFVISRLTRKTFKENRRQWYSIELCISLLSTGSWNWKIGQYFDQKTTNVNQSMTMQIHASSTLKYCSYFTRVNKKVAWTFSFIGIVLIAWL